MSLAHLPFQLSCSSCEHILLEAFIAIEGEEITPDAIIIEQANLMCPSCQRIIKSSIDDLTKALNMILETNK